MTSRCENIEIGRGFASDRLFQRSPTQTKKSFFTAIAKKSSWLPLTDQRKTETWTGKASIGRTPLTAWFLFAFRRCQSRGLRCSLADAEDLAAAAIRRLFGSAYQPWDPVREPNLCGILATR